MQIKPHYGFDYDCQVANFTINDRDYLVSELQRHKVLRFRNQSVDPDQLAVFTQYSIRNGIVPPFVCHGL